VATALESGSIQKDSIFYCEEGEYQIQDRVIHDVAKYGWLPLEKIIQKSSNICAAKIGQRIPKPIFYRSIREFGFGTKTGINLPGEVSGKVHNYQDWSDTDVATISFGHTISATPIQVISAINTIATGGVLVKPKIIKSALKSNGSQVFRDNTKGKRIIKPETAEIVKSFMLSVIQPGGTGYLANIKGISIAGKTGTSRKFDLRKREYSKINHITSFIGFFPAEKPQITILVVIDEKPLETHLILTGRNAGQRIIDRADLVTEMREIKHPYQQGIKAQRGVEF
jgi:cell division protein FtsI (penicillin-binding protein 3)